MGPRAEDERGSGNREGQVLRDRSQVACEGRFLRSPFYALFRVGYANLLLVNVHLAAGKAAANSELSALHNLAAAVERPNARLFRRHSLSGRLRGRAPRGLTVVLGDFNCSAGPAVALARPAAGAAPAPAAPAPPARAPPGPVCEATMRPGARPATAPATAPAAAPAAVPAAPAPDGWPAFQRHGWLNALAQPRPPTTAAHGAPAPAAPPLLTATNWRAKQPLALDAICLPGAHAGLVTGRGVCAPPPYVDASQPAVYPNHLLCWVRLDLGPLQRAPGKVRPLLGPVLEAAGR
ncbi:hypothetical protein TSOC_005492 [Tetrabaena socialis]|uniref:Endonuclease/exonuclease/phosphatase domain-containing protein n=1 Tax=Tetrabaena socialis TaxID=47790 RepID=A0A2J8A634_9CHLO|nr:hypothetical protein TSOC_005492 [Tetrabaena socialis]|eukprot:PNH07992.1 hypothetical protein TSOC_005492 [Tetrabaena socialis]